MEIPRGDAPIRLEGGRLDTRKVALAAGDFLQVMVIQQGIDVELRLRDAAGELVHAVDSPNGRRGPEELLVIAERAGEYRIEVAAPATAPPGDYRFVEPLIRPATPDDRQLVEADRQERRGYQLADAADDPRSAIAPLEQALAYWQRRGELARQAATLAALGIAYRRLDGERRRALAVSDQAAELYRRLGDDYQLGHVLLLTGFLRLGGDTRRAIADLEEARQRILATRDARTAALCSSHLGTAHWTLGNVERAIELFEGALRELGPSPDEQRANVLVDYGRALLVHNAAEPAYRAFAEAGAIYRRLGRPNQNAIALGGMADAAERGDALAAARELVDEALGEMGPAAQAAFRATLTTLRGRLEMRSGELEKAKVTLDAAVALAEPGGGGPLASALEPRGLVALRRGRPAEALRDFERARAIFAAENRSGLASAQARCAEALQALGRLEEARERILEAIAGVEELRADARQLAVRRSYFGFRQNYFSTAIDILMELDRRHPEKGYDREALALHESRSAVELRARREAGPAAGAAQPELKEKEAELERELTRRDAEARAHPSAEAEAAAAQALQDLERVWKQMNPEPAPLRPAISLDLFRELLDGDTLALVYVLGERRSFLFALSREGLRHAELPGREEIESETGLFTAEVARAGVPAQGERLAEMLLGPVAGELGSRRLVVIAEGGLQRLPFAALPRLGGRRGFLIEDHEIVTLPSLTSLSLVREKAPAAPEPGRMAVFADPVFSPGDPRCGTASASSAPAAPSASSAETSALGLAGEIRSIGLGLRAVAPRRLPFTRREAEALAGRLPGKSSMYLDFAASRDGFLALPDGRYRLLHIATHAAASHRFPELSGLFFSQMNAAGQEVEGFVRAFEIARKDWRAELVNLSACDTGLGPEIAGEGLLGLSRAFLEAGARRVIASLWNVDDRSTAALMARFYEEHLGRGLAPAAALRAAQVALLAAPETAQPYHWAAFVLQGDWRPESL